MVTGPWLLVIFLLSIVFVLVVIIKLKLNPFIALLLTALLTGLAVRMPLAKISEAMATGFGNTLKGIGIVIGLGIIFGRILAESGATDQIANALVKRVGKERSPLAVALTGYLISIPVFFDAGFVILISVIKKLSVITKKPLIVLVTALSVGLISSHNLLIPTPGPVEVANSLGVNLGVFFMYSFFAGLPGVLLAGWLYGLWVGKGEGAGIKVEEKPAAKKRGAMPSTFASFFYLLLPIVLILLGSIMTLILDQGTLLYRICAFIGDKNIALLVSVLVTIVALRKCAPDMGEAIMRASESSGLILLVTGAGGAFGYLVNASGIGSYLVETLSSWNLSILFTGFILAALLRGAQGSATVSLVTTSAILGPVVHQTGTSPVLTAMAICAGGFCLSLPNDSAFWVVTRFSDIRIPQTMKAWSLGSTLAGLITFAIVLLLSLISSILPGL